jgi:zinc finger protein
MRSLLDHILEMKEGEVDEERNFAKREALILPSSCHHCLSEGNMISCLIDIPHFKEVLIMAFNCDSCGFRSSEIKPGGTIPTRGTQITFTVETTDDFAREVLKSDFCHLTIPEISLELDYGSLGSMFTTVEGLLSKMLFTLKDGHPFFLGDSATQHHAEHLAEDDNARKFADFVANFESLVQGELMPFTVIMRDPMGNSFVSPPYGQTPEEDGQVVYEDYDRTAEEEDFMGLTGMHVGGEHEEGEEGEEEQVVVQSDRLAFPHDHGLDHPTPFTAGQMLSTDRVEGEVLAPDRANRQQQEQQQEEQG